MNLNNELTKFIEATHIVVPLAEAQHEPACCNCTQYMGRKKNMNQFSGQKLVLIASLFIMH